MQQQLLHTNVISSSSWSLPDWKSTIYALAQREKERKKTGLTSNWSYTRITHRNKCLFLLSVHEQSFFVCDVFFSRRLSVYFVHRLLILRRGRQDERREWKKKCGFFLPRIEMNAWVKMFYKSFDSVRFFFVFWLVFFRGMCDESILYTFYKW